MPVSSQKLNELRNEQDEIHQIKHVKQTYLKHELERKIALHG